MFDWDDFPVILGQGSCHTLTDDAGRIYGKEGARIRVRPKPRPIGFHLPRRSK